MRLRTFNAPDMQLAMQMIRETLGDEAVIISSTRSDHGNGVVVIAATEQNGRDTMPAPPVTSFLHAVSFLSLIHI